MKKSLLVLVASFLACVSAMAQVKYNLKVNGIDVTSENAASITGDGIGGTISYDAASNVLTLENATVNATGGNNALESKNDGLTILLVGENNLTSTSAATVCLFNKTTITGTGSLSASASSSTGIQQMDYSLDITGGCSVTAIGIGGISGLSGNEVLNIRGSKVVASGFIFGAISDINVNLFNCEIESGSYYGDDVTIVPVATGIHSAVTSDNASAPVYNLNGVRLNSVPSKGVYIKNGKKVIGK